MQAAPAVTVSVGRDGATLAALAVLSALAATCCAAWALHRADPAGSLVLLSVLAGSVLLVLAEARRLPRRLRWDGQVWWLGPASDVAPPLSGDVTLAIDLDAWLLLRFRAHPAYGSRRTQWLALRRAAHRSDWHALRCAIYSPRPARLTAG